MEPLRIVGVVVAEVTEPRNDGSAGSALYRVPIRLNRPPDAIEREQLVAGWDLPPRWTTMHRPGILRVSGDRLLLDGTTVEEVERYHAQTLSLVVEQTNRDAVDRRTRARRKADREADLKATATQEHRANVAEVAKRIRF